MARNSEEMIEELFEAFDTIMNARMQTLNFDRTILCTIEEILPSQAENKYRVSDGITNYIAYAIDGSTYEKGDSVYILIPDNNFNEQITILRKYINANTLPLNYVSPLESFFKCTDNLINGAQGNWSILANHPEILSKQIWSWNKGDSNFSLVGYDIMGIKINFNTYRLASWEVIQGNYGLKIFITYASTENKIKEIEFNIDSSKIELSKIYGIDGIIQEKLFNISDLNEILGMTLYLYQNNNFYNKSQKIPCQYNDIDYFEDNIKIENLEIYFGYEKDKYNNGDVVLYSLNGNNYGIDSEQNEKKLCLRWIQEDNFILDREEEFLKLNPPAEIHWMHRQKINRQSEQKDYETENWFEFYKEIGTLSKEQFDSETNLYNLISNSNYEFNKSDKYEEDTIYYAPFGIEVEKIDLSESENPQEEFQVIIEYPSKNYLLGQYNNDKDVIVSNILLKLYYTNSTNIMPNLRDNLKIISDFMELSNQESFYIDDDLEQTLENIIYFLGRKYSISQQRPSAIFNKVDEDNNKKREEYLREAKYYYSNVLTFNNLNFSYIEKNIASQEIIIKNDEEGYHGIYFLYDNQNKIKNEVESQIKRKLEFNAYTFLSRRNKTLDDVSVTWYIPMENTMINWEAIEREYEVKYYSQNSILEKNYYLFEEINKENATYIGIQKNSEIFYLIRSYYNAFYKNNTIYFQLESDNEIYQKSIELLFGPQGTQGTEYTFVLIPSSMRPLTKDFERLELTPCLLDGDGKEINIYNKEITADWYSPLDSRLDISFNNGKIIITPPEEDNIDIEELKYHILKTSVQYEGKVFYGFFPIPISAEDSDFLYYGTTQIMYNEMGGSPNFYKNEHKLYQNDTELDVSWIVEYESEQETEEELESDAAYYPRFLSQQKNNLAVSNLYISNLSKKIAISAYDKNNNLIYSYPIRIFLNNFSSAFLNSWNGNLTIDEKNDTILSSVIGAGKKEEDNSFSGILMGDLQEEEPKYVGLFGYSHGEKNFGFNVDGTAFLGKPDGTGINFDGRNGFARFTSGDNSIIIDSSENSSDTKALFAITSKGTNLLHISNRNYFLRSSEYNTSSIEEKGDLFFKSNPSRGIRINLQDGTLKGSSLNLSLKNTNREQYFSINGTDEQTPFRIGNASFLWDGSFFQDNQIYDNEGIRSRINEKDVYRFYLNLKYYNQDKTIFNSKDFYKTSGNGAFTNSGNDYTYFYEKGDWKYSINGWGNRTKFRLTQADGSNAAAGELTPQTTKFQVKSFLSGDKSFKNPHHDSTALFIGRGKTEEEYGSKSYSKFYTRNIFNDFKKYIESSFDLEEELTNQEVLDKSRVSEIVADFLRTNSPENFSFIYKVDIDLEEDSQSILNLYKFEYELPSNLLETEFVEAEEEEDFIEEDDEEEVPAPEQPEEETAEEDEEVPAPEQPEEESEIYLTKIVEEKIKKSTVVPHKLFGSYFSVTYGGKVFCQRLYTKNLYADKIFTKAFYLFPEDDVTTGGIHTTPAARNSLQNAYVAQNMGDNGLKISYEELKNYKVIRNIPKVLTYENLTWEDYIEE